MTKSDLSQRRVQLPEPAILATATLSPSSVARLEEVVFPEVARERPLAVPPNLNSPRLGHQKSKSVRDCCGPNQGSHQLGAAHAGHHHIRDEQIRGMRTGAECTERLVAVLSGQDFITGMHEHRTEELPYRRIIIYK
jgi:hypothetical protein